MKSIVISILIGITLLLTSCEEEDCTAVASCAPPDISNLLQLRIDLSSFEEAEIADAQLMRIAKSNNEIIDTLQLKDVNNFENEIIIGRNSTIQFNVVTAGFAETASLDYRVLIGNPIQVFNISDIRVRRIDNECFCPEYFLESLRFNNELMEINNTVFSLRL